jgi:hypothetical protein
VILSTAILCKCFSVFVVCFVLFCFCPFSASLCVAGFCDVTPIKSLRRFFWFRMLLCVVPFFCVCERGRKENLRAAWGMYVPVFWLSFGCFLGLGFEGSHMFFSFFSWAFLCTANLSACRWRFCFIIWRIVAFCSLLLLILIHISLGLF